MARHTGTRKSLFQVVIRETLTPLLLMFLVPNTMICVLHIVVNHRSQIRSVVKNDLGTFWLDAWKEAGVGDAQTWTAVLIMASWSALSILLLGGERYDGPPTKNGFRPKYIKSGVTYYFLTLAVFGIAVYLDLVPAWMLYKKLVQVAGTLLVFGFVVCVFLYFKGIVAPSPGEHGSSGNPVFDFYWGMELYPRLGQWFDMKLWTNSRFGLMLWQIFILVAWKAQHEHSGWNYAMAATCILQSLFLLKFYFWEDGYMKTIDIIVDRAGFYICWGCIFFVPTFYTLTSSYMVENSPDMGLTHFLILVGIGSAAVGLDYWPDYQRQLARATDGKCTIWGKPAKVIRATYLDDKGYERKNVLLASGFWGWSRHINYVFEITATFLWEAPAGAESIFPYFYGIFLIILLVHRSFRDEEKCRLKYGRHWQDYCKISKYQIMPFVF